MSRANVEVMRAAFEAWNAGDMDATRKLYDPEVIMRNPEGWPEPGPVVGREAVMRQIEQLRETWDTDALEPISDFIDAADRVVVRSVPAMVAGAAPRWCRPAAGKKRTTKNRRRCRSPGLMAGGTTVIDDARGASNRKGSSAILLPFQPRIAPDRA